MIVVGVDTCSYASEESNPEIAVLDNLFETRAQQDFSFVCSHGVTAAVDSVFDDWTWNGWGESPRVLAVAISDHFASSGSLCLCVLCAFTTVRPTTPPWNITILRYSFFFYTHPVLTFPDRSGTIHYLQFVGSYQYQMILLGPRYQSDQHNDRFDVTIRRRGAWALSSPRPLYDPLPCSYVTRDTNVSNPPIIYQYVVAVAMTRHFFIVISFFPPRPKSVEELTAFDSDGRKRFFFFFLRLRMLYRRFGSSSALRLLVLVVVLPLLAAGLRGVCLRRQLLFVTIFHAWCTGT